MTKTKSRADGRLHGQISNMEDPDNRSVFICNHYPATEGHEFKPGAARITAHTDETLITLVLTSPGDTCSPATIRLSRKCTHAHVLIFLT